MVCARTEEEKGHAPRRKKKKTRTVKGEKRQSQIQKGDNPCPHHMNTHKYTPKNKNLLPFLFLSLAFFCLLQKGREKYLVRPLPAAPPTAHLIRLKGLAGQAVSQSVRKPVLRCFFGQIH